MLLVSPRSDSSRLQPKIRLRSCCAARCRAAAWRNSSSIGVPGSRHRSIMGLAPARESHAACDACMENAPAPARPCRCHPHRPQQSDRHAAERRAHARAGGAQHVRCLRQHRDGHDGGRSPAPHRLDQRRLPAVPAGAGLRARRAVRRPADRGGGAELADGPRHRQRQGDPGRPAQQHGRHLPGQPAAAAQRGRARSSAPSAWCCSTSPKPRCSR